MCKQRRILLATCAISTLLVFGVMTAQAQSARFTDSQSGFSFQPPPGWSYQFLGPEREDGGGPVLLLDIADTLINLSDTNNLTKDIQDQLRRDEAEAVNVSDPQKRTVAGRDGLQIDVSYRRGKVSIRERRVYVPATEQSRTYVFTLMDRAEYFDQTAAAADPAISSFALTNQAGGRSGARDGDESKTGSGTIPLALGIILGSIALIVVLVSGFLLLRSRSRAVEFR